MKITILTTITNPEERQDKWKEAISCYTDFADEVVVVNGGINSYFPEGNEKIKEVMMFWPYEWNWVEYPRHMNEGLKHCTGDWIIRLDIDQFLHEDDFAEIRKVLSNLAPQYEVVTFQKMSYTYASKYYQKGGQSIAFRNLPHIKLGKNVEQETDLCFPIRQTGVEVIQREDSKEILYELPIGTTLKTGRTGIQYWNYDYCFKTKEFTRKEFWRAARAWHRYYEDWAFGDSEENSFNYFMHMLKGRYEKSPYTAKILSIHPKYIQKAIAELKPEQFGFNGWGMFKS